jgi:phosphonopyruvate decarboxylase
MIDTKQFLDDLISNGIEKLIGVPCSFLGSLINEAENRNIYEPFVNEGDALAYAAGMVLAGRRCAVVMQNSGFSNALSPLTSLNELFGLNVLLIIGNRGLDDEPQHRIMSGVVKPMLEILKISHFDAEDHDALHSALSRLKHRSVALLVNNKNTFSPVSPATKTSMQGQTAALPLRRDILRAISACAGNSVIVTTTGFTSREMFCVKDRAENFYMVGSMGCLSSLALGIADGLPDKTVIAIDGDSACLMRLGALYTLTQKQPRNLCYMVLDNEANESTGGQRNSLGESRLFDVMSALYATAEARSAGEVAAMLQTFRQLPRYTQIYAKISRGTIKNLPRPDKQLIHEQAKRFMQAVLR